MIKARLCYHILTSLYLPVRRYASAGTSYSPVWKETPTPARFVQPFRYNTDLCHTRTDEHRAIAREQHGFETVAYAHTDARRAIATGGGV